MAERVANVALIGSFRQHFDAVHQSLLVFRAVGLEVTSPKSTVILKHGIPFVRFDSDPQEWSNEMIQVVALHRILRADFVFVVAPDGYVGRTTCYEIGRVIQSRRAIYFSELPKDFPLLVPDTHVLTASAIADQVRSGVFHPQRIHSSAVGDVGELEQGLLDGTLHDI